MKRYEAVMKLYFNTKLIILTVVILFLILGVVFFIGLELGRIADRSNRDGIVDTHSEKVINDAKDEIKNIREAELLPGQPLGSGK